MKLFPAVLILLAVLLPLRLRAMDPVTIAVLAPVAIEGAKIAAPYVIRGLASGGRHMVQMAGHTAELLLLPWGVGQLLVMDWASGAGSIVQGLCAPLKLAGDALLLPVAFCGIDIGV